MCFHLGTHSLPPSSVMQTSIQVIWLADSQMFLTNNSIIQWLKALVYLESWTFCNSSEARQGVSSSESLPVIVMTSLNKASVFHARHWWYVLQKQHVSVHTVSHFEYNFHTFCWCYCAQSPCSVNVFSFHSAWRWNMVVIKWVDVLVKWVPGQSSAYLASSKIKSTTLVQRQPFHKHLLALINASISESSCSVRSVSVTIPTSGLFLHRSARFHGCDLDHLQ